MDFRYYITARYIIFLMFFISIGLPVYYPVFAQSEINTEDREASIYTIYNVDVDETARNVTLAREQALNKGQRLALERLFRRIILISDRKKLPNFSDQQVMDFISGFEINDERRSDVRYIASLVVHFNRDKVNEVLSSYEIPFAETLGTAVSVLPVLEEGGALMLWEKNNKWREAWQNYDVINNLVPINTPEPTLMNRMYISALQAKNDDQDVIRAFIQKNTLNELIVVTANVIKDTAANQLVLEMALRRNDILDEGTENPLQYISVSVPAYDELGLLNEDALFKAGVDAATDWVDDLWKSKVLVNYGSKSSIMAHGELKRIDDWVIIQQQLKKVNLVRKVNLKGITINNVDIEIEFAGDEEQLALSLAQQGLALTQNQGTMDWNIALTDLATNMSRN